MWRQPLARATHAPPDGFSHFFWRFLLIGHDYYWQQQLIVQFGENPTAQLVENGDPMTGWKGNFTIFGDRLSKMFAEAPLRHTLNLPLAIPIAILSILLIAAGYTIASVKPKILLNTYHRIVGE